MALSGKTGHASVKDVAAAAEVSLGTVSNVLNRPERVSPKTRARVEKAMLDLGFVRNESARSLRSGHSRTLAYVMLDAGNPFFTDVAQGIEEVAEQADLSLFFCNSDNRAEREAAHLRHLLQHRAQGVLITPVDNNSQFLNTMASRGTPVVIIDRPSTQGDFSSVSVDDVLGGQLAVEHLISLGHRKIAFAGGLVEIGQIHDRLHGARLAIQKAGLAQEDLIEIPCETLTLEAGRKAAEHLAAIPAATRPTAIFCANDLIALGVLQHATARGWSIPSDLAIVGFDDISFASSAAVPLTSVSQPREELGRSAAELVLDEASNPNHVHKHIVFTPTLVARASTLG